MDRFTEALGEVYARYTYMERPRGTVQQQVRELGWVAEQMRRSTLRLRPSTPSFGLLGGRGC
jgi:hypothetical protein